MGKGTISGEKRPGRSIDYLPHLVPRLRMGGAVPLHPLCDFMACYGATFTFYYKLWDFVEIIIFLSPFLTGFAVLERVVKALWSSWQWPVSLWLKWIPGYLAIINHQKMSRIPIQKIISQEVLCCTWTSKIHCTLQIFYILIDYFTKSVYPYECFFFFLWN